MKIQLDNCLEHETILDYVLEPIWGEIIFGEYCPPAELYYTHYYKDEGFCIKIGKIGPNHTSLVKVEILGYTINSSAALCDSSSSCEGKIIGCIRYIESKIMGYTKCHEQFARCPIFIMLHIAIDEMKSFPRLYFMDIKWNNCSISIGGWNNYMCINGETISFDNQEKDIPLLITSMINGSAPANCYTEIPIKRIKAAK